MKTSTQIDALLLEALPKGRDSAASMRTMRQWAQHLLEITGTQNLAALIRARSPGERWREASALESRGWRTSA